MKLIKLSCLAALFVLPSVTFADHNKAHTIEQRLKPIGEVNIKNETSNSSATEATSTTAQGTRQGATIYQKYCFACHLTGAAGAPKLEAAAWTERRKQGIDTLLQTVKNGKNAMPPKGTCMDCTDEELKNAIQYMLDQAK